MVCTYGNTAMNSSYVVQADYVKKTLSKLKGLVKFTQALRLLSAYCESCSEH
jgi:hypothetical protein